ncbi:D-alanyl-D-alanine carboxypeptidase family protein [Neisseria musculi]|uniref:D-alanyl-D-alanine carboxypeptidase family protein n=1 Tax=Neisseria musculi TaxID=1815583 RepID=UPI00164AD794|nr:D-alanyl-D-alanine carboxypeptidase family protein [Neisseria musculi]QNT59059.1 D-alanyl-D-alanine carboxypeptidase family protein [Neisseria musculi]
MKKTLLGLSAAALIAGQAAAAPQAASAEASAHITAAAALPAVSAVAAPEIAASAYLVKDLQSGQILAGKNINTQVEPASLTKLMTAYLTFKALDNGTLKPDQMLTVSSQGWRAEGSRMFLDPKKPASVSDLIKGLIVQSGNDAAITLAEAIGGSEEGFAAMMDAEAKRLGMTHTHYTNSTGLPGDGHLTTVNDLAVLAGAIIRDFPKYYPIYSMKSFKYNNIEQPNRNLLLYRDSSIDGLKTGHTSSAGYNLVASSKRNGRRVVSVVVGTESTEARASESSKLLNWVLQSYDTPKLYDANQTISQVKVYKGSANAVGVGFLNAAYVTIPHGEGQNIKPVLETVQPVLAPIQKGQVLGKLRIMNGSTILAEKNVVALNAVDEAGWFGRAYDSIVLWFKSLFSDE